MKITKIMESVGDRVITVEQAVGGGVDLLLWEDFGDGQCEIVGSLSLREEEAEVLVNLIQKLQNGNL